LLKLVWISPRLAGWRQTKFGRIHIAEVRDEIRITEIGILGNLLVAYQ